ncbi:MAG: glucans biosynthesis glucosyltransferase MdoH [Hyphomicrobium sp.]
MDEAVNENFKGSLPVREAHDVGFANLPEPAPLLMPEQDFSQTIARAAEPRRRGYWVPRSAIFVGAGVLTAAFASELFSILAFGQMTPLQFVFLVLSTIAFGWIALGSLSAALGFLPLFAGEDAATITPRKTSRPLVTRTALLFPVYHEDPSRIAGTIEAMASALGRLAPQGAFDIFVLSDTRGAEDGAREDIAYSRLKSAIEDKINFFYRRRRDNTHRKAGNIADWIERFGAAYDHFVILDADSVMSAETLIALAGAMEDEQKAGLIQTVPRLVGGRTLLQHLTQFASSVYGPSVASGIAFWHRDQGNYWGHNAIIRTVAFASSAGLPELSGRKPFGGHILSHDFVEAVLLQRAGWGVHMMPTIEGSYEGQPPNIVDVVVRDRRWAQGNLQHLAIVGQAGLTPMGRVHLGMGAASYLISGIWALSLVVGMVLALQGGQFIPSYFEDSKTLFPIWPVIDPGAALRLFMATLAVVFLPKLLGLLLELKRARIQGSPMHALRSTVGVVYETIYSMLIAPILMITQTVGAIQIFAGLDSGWKAQKRDDGALSFSDAMKFARLHTLIGALVAAIAWKVSPGLLVWMAPVVAGLLLAGPVSWLTARPVGAFSRWALATREEIAPPQIIVDVDKAADVWRQRLMPANETEALSAAAAA